MHSKGIWAVTLAAILIFSTTASALAQEQTFSARVLAKGKKSNILLIVINSSKSTQSIHQLEVTFTQGSPLSAIVRGWDADKNGNIMKFTAERGDIGPGGKAVFIIRAVDPASSAFNWSVKANDGNELKSGTVSKIRIREPAKDSDSILPPVTTPEVNVNKIKALPGEQITITGKGYAPTSTVTIFIGLQEVGRSTTDAAGTFNSVILIATNSATGLQLVRAVDSTNKSAVIQILIETPAGSLPPLQGGRLEARLDKVEYDPGEIIRVTGSAVLDTPVSLQIIDPKGGIICGANPRVNNQTLLWDATCIIPGNAVAGRYTLEAKQIVHRTTAVFNVRGPAGGTGGTGGTGSIGEPGEDPGPLKMSTDKQNYKVGDTARVTVTGARPSSLLDVIIDGPGSPTAQRLTADSGGSATISIPLSGSNSVGVWKVSAKQMDAEQKKQFVVRIQFTVET